MPNGISFMHTNLIARDLHALADFYTGVLGCVTLQEQELKGVMLETATGLPGAHLHGLNLLLPGFGADGPVLEIFQYVQAEDRVPTAINRIGSSHLAFKVEDIAAVQAAILAVGGRKLGEITTTPIGGGVKVLWTYLTDPEDNALELISFVKE